MSRVLLAVAGLVAITITGCSWGGSGQPPGNLTPDAPEVKLFVGTWKDPNPVLPNTTGLSVTIGYDASRKNVTAWLTGPHSPIDDSFEYPDNRIDSISGRTLVFASVNPLGKGNTTIWTMTVDANDSAQATLSSDTGGKPLVLKKR